ncbi:MAG: hypothetical protein U1A16_03980, partial [Patescibacteria group bacterium]|nr:hypothetical protein [Patescibacteria group bacterium]
ALGHGVEEKKNVLWAKGFEKAATQFDRRSIAGRFIASLAQSFREDAAEARKKIEEIRALRAEDQGARLLRHKVGGIGYLVGNITKYARFIGDLPGVDAFVFAPRRYWMMGGMLVGRLAGAVKETRLTGEKAMERARGAKAPEGRNLASGLEIADEQEWDKLDLDPDYKKAVDDAWDEALHVYADARKKSGERKVSCGDLEKAYQQNIPQQVLERLQKQSTEAGIVAGLPRRVTQWVAERSIASVAKKIEAIEENPNLTAAEKEAAKEEVAVRYRKRLRDLDRMVDYYGAVDGIAAAAKSTEFAGKAAVAAMSVDTLYAGVRHLWERGLPEFFVNATRHAKDLFSGTVLTPTTLGASDFRASSAFQNSAAAGKPGVAEHDALYGRSLGAQRGSAGTSPAETPGTSSREAASGAGGGGGPRPEAARAAQAAGETPDAVPRGGAKPEAGAAKAAAWERTAGKKDSPLSLAKKIYMEQAQRFGYKGDLKDVAALRQWAETQSTRSIVGQYIRGNQGQYQELIGKIGKPPADPQEMDVWLKKVPVKTFNNILHDKVPNLIHPGDIVRVTENGEITALSLDGKTARLGRIDVAESARARGGRGPVQPRESIFQPEKGYAYDPTTGRNNPQLDLEPFSAPSRLEQTVGLPGSEELAHVSRALNVDLSSVDGDVAFEAVRDYQIFTKGTLLDKENIVERLERDIGHLKQIAGTDAQHEAAVKTIIANHFTDLIERSYTQYFRLLGQYGLDEVKVEQLEGLGRGDVGRVLNMLGAAQEIEGVGVNIGGNTGVFRNKYDADQFGEYLRRLLGRTPSLAREPLEEALKRQVR